MKKVFFVIALAVIILTGCASYTIWYRQDGVVPFNYYQAVKNTGERLVFISPVLASNHRQSGLYIITNPEDIDTALDTIGDPGVIRPNDLNIAIRPFSPVIIMSSRDIPTVDRVNNFNISNQDGIAGFSLPPSVDHFFYAYITIKQNYRWGSNDPTEVRVGVIQLPPGSEDIYIAFSERGGEMVVSGDTTPAAVKNAYNKTNGYYGQLLGKKDQTGFINIGFKERFEIVRITPPPQNIAPPVVRERYSIPVTATLIGDYAKYNVITERNIVGKSERWQLSKDQILDWIELNKDNVDFANALAICTIIADEYDYRMGEFVCVDYCAMFIGIDAKANRGRLGEKTILVMDDDHIWMRINIPNKYRDSNGGIKNSDYLWVDPTWFDNDSNYNFNFFTWGGNVPQFMEGGGGGGHQCHKLGKTYLGQPGKSPIVPGFTYSVVYDGSKYICVEDDFGRRRQQGF